VGRWRRRRQDPPSELSELDPFLLAMISRLVAARSEGSAGDDEWVAIEQVAALTAKMAEAAQTALRAGWDADAERRTLIERRSGPRGIEVRLTGTARDLLGT
jgi:hypothetical protein